MSATIAVHNDDRTTLEEQGVGMQLCLALQWGHYSRNMRLDYWRNNAMNIISLINKLNGNNYRNVADPKKASLLFF